MSDRIEREMVLEASPDEVWQALTDPGWLAEWLADEVVLELVPGGEAWFRFGDTVRTGWVEEIAPPGSRAQGRLAFWWADGIDTASRVELSLTDDDGRTRLRVTETRPLEVLDLVGLRLPGLGGGSYGPALVAA
jgi:uncharacterized protein YndB with AHSA1/START domain